MPLIQISILEGRSDEMKKDMMMKVAEAVAETLHAPKESIRILIHELPHNHWGVGGIPMSELKR